MTILMPKATAVWLIDNTGLTFLQIGDFVKMHELEIKAIADGDAEINVQGENPLQSSILTEEEIARCLKDPAARLVLNPEYRQLAVNPKGGRRYTPMLKRANKPNAIAWLVREYPEMTDTQIGKLVGSTKPIIASIRNRSHWNMANITPASPVELGLCTLNDLNKFVDIALATRQKNKIEAEQEASASL